jgi:hypothetical protein
MFYITSKTDEPNYDDINKKGIITKGMSPKKYNKKNIEELLRTDNFLKKFKIFIDIHTILRDNEILVKPFNVMNNRISYRPYTYSDTNNFVFVCHTGDDFIVVYKELWGKRCRKIIAHMILENKYDDFISHMEEAILTNI